MNKQKIKPANYLNSESIAAKFYFTKMRLSQRLLLDGEYMVPMRLTDDEGEQVQRAINNQRDFLNNLKLTPSVN